MMNYCKIFLFGFSLYFISLTAQTQVVINEIQITNGTTLPDEDGEFGDWIELYNSGNTPVNLEGYGLSDDPTEPMKWLVPDITLDPGARKVIHASGKDRTASGSIDHYETPVFPWSTWQYTIPTSQPNNNWRLPGFSGTGWQEGTGGFGYGDADDGTELPTGTISVFSRISFTLTDATSFEQGYFLMDYDDGFVAYLNGVEIARLNCGLSGVDFPYNSPATGEHEAAGYQDLPWDNFVLDAPTLQTILQNGENVLAIQVHNISNTSSDLTCNAMLILANSDSNVQTELAPGWLNLQVPPVPLLHTNFKLSAGELLTLYAPDQTVLDNITLPALQLDHVFQRSGDGNLTWCISTVPTPDAANNTACQIGYETPPIFSLSSGAYSNTQTIALTSINPLAQIRYTTDGSIPTSESTLYTAPLNVSETVVISARCFSSTSLPSAVEKNTYLINEYDIDIPVVSISTDPYNLWDSLYGIHVFGPPDYGGYPYFGANFWEDWERQSYMEYFDANHILQVEGPVGLKIHGGWSRGNDQKSFRVQCKDQYGMESMNYPFMQDKPWITSFKGFNLRNGGNDYWGYRFHDALMQRAMRGTKADYMGYTPVIVFLNGEYWGFMEMREVLDEHWVEDNYGIDNDDVTVISYNYTGLNVLNGSDESFYPMFNNIMNLDPNSEEFYNFINENIDLENYADYIIAETYWCNGDWSNGWINNTKFWHDDTDGGKWRFMLMDLDFGMGLVGNQPCDDYIYTAQDEGYYTDQMFSRIIQNETFRQYFITRYADLMNTTFRPERINEMGNAMRDEIEDIFERHCQRWYTDYGSLQWSLDNRLEWNEERNECAFDVVQEHFGLQDQIELTFEIEPAGAGRIHINTIEPSEEMYPWTGIYYQGIPVQITVVANPGYVFHHWEANGVFPVNAYLDQFTMNFEDDETFVAHFTGSEASNALVVSEFMFNDDNENESGDWIEIHNTLNVPVDLTGMYMKDNNYFNRFDFPLNTTIPANGYMVFAEDTALFAQQYPDITQVTGPLHWSLSNAGDAIRLFSFHDENMIHIDFLDESPWPANTDGTGRTNEYDLTATNQNLGSNWFEGCIDGSPAAPFDEDCGINHISVETSFDFSIFPVPASDVLNLHFPRAMKSALVQLYNPQGQLILSTAMTGVTSRIDVSQLAEGAYFLKLMEEGVNLNSKPVSIVR